MTTSTPIRSRSGARALVVIATLAAGCRRDTAAAGAGAGVVGWRPVGEWTGTAPLQTGTFTSDTGSFRVHWQARTTGASPETGTLHVVFRSADSGNPIIDAVTQRGPGEGVATVSAERPRWYYLGVESSDVAWTIRIEEPIVGRSAPGGR